MLIRLRKSESQKLGKEDMDRRVDPNEQSKGLSKSHQLPLQPVQIDLVQQKATNKHNGIHNRSGIIPPVLTI